MADIKIPPIVQEKYPDLVKMIFASPSMDDSERSYWLGMLVIMTPEQVKNLEDILVREKQKLETPPPPIEKPAEDTTKLEDQEKADEARLKASQEKQKILEEQEKEEQVQEVTEEENILNEINAL